jgi:hypothetical protein
MSHVSCLMSFASWFMTHVFCFLSHEIWDMTPWRGGGTWDMRHETWAMSPAGSRHENWAMRHNSCLVAHGSWLMTHVLYLTVHVLPIFMAHASRRMAHVSRLTSHVSCPIVFFTYHVSYGSSWAHGSCFMCHVPCFHVSCFISNGSCLMFYHDSCLMFYASRFMSQVSCLTSHVSRLI